MAWKVTISGKSMLLDDLTPDEFMAACLKHPGVNWLQLYVSPAVHPGAYHDLLNIAARKLEVPTPDAPATIKDSVKLLELIERVDDDLPAQWGDNAIPLAQAAELETTTSSTSTERADGARAKPERRH